MNERNDDPLAGSEALGEIQRGAETGLEDNPWEETSTVGAEAAGTRFDAAAALKQITNEVNGSESSALAL